jgi:hypothetical protein
MSRAAKVRFILEVGGETSSQDVFSLFCATSADLDHAIEIVRRANRLDFRTEVNPHTFEPEHYPVMHDPDVEPCYWKESEHEQAEREEAERQSGYRIRSGYKINGFVVAFIQAGNGYTKHQHTGISGRFGSLRLGKGRKVHVLRRKGKLEGRRKRGGDSEVGRGDTSPIRCQCLASVALGSLRLGCQSDHEGR